MSKCLCGCGKEMPISEYGPAYDSKRKYLFGHQSNGKNNPFYNQKHTKASLEKISSSSLQRWQDPIFIKKYWKGKNKKSAIKKQTAGCRKGALARLLLDPSKKFRNTEPELLMKKYLSELEIEFIHSHSIMDIKHFYPCDFYLPKYNLVIETDGVYYHNYPNYRPIDLIRTKELKEKGYKLIRFWYSNKRKLRIIFTKEDIIKRLSEEGIII